MALHSWTKHRPTPIPGPLQVMATTVTESGGVRIITEVIPNTDPRAAQLASGSIQPTVSSFQVSGFRRAQPKVLGVSLWRGRARLLGIVLLMLGSGWDAHNGNANPCQHTGDPLSSVLSQTIHIVTGIIHLCFGVILTCAENNSVLSLPVASGVFFWLGVLLLVSGSLLVESEKRENILLVKVCCVANAAVILSTLVAMLIHTVAITHSIPGCSSSASMPLLVRQEWCFSAETKALSNGFDCIFVLFSLLEFCTAVAALAFGWTAIKQYSYTRMVRGSAHRLPPQQALTPALRLLLLPLQVL
ncbi:uncharacterized protein LOC116242916 isoform X2 [Phasianus colchicus]|uniref:uncharacterized protein LOC116242916 isoform X2 n=1 Tax=Phasianus colchicus TaxID=9054 RepID=UPI00129D379E|nr:uncharacterized protein LOC116242916 isoform X2 [Phasianus colchicus]